MDVVSVDLVVPLAEEARLLGNSARRIRYVALDVRDRVACFDAILHVRPTHILHGAAVTLGDVKRTRAVNLCGTANVLDAAAAAGSVKRCVILSSSGLYSQDAHNASCHEQDALDLRSEYARTKREAELLMAGCEAAGGFIVAAARVGPVYGPLERERSTRPRISLIGQLLEHYHRGQGVSISGLEMYRDWTHASDVVAALDALLFAPALRYRVYNVSTGVACSARQAIALFEEAGLVVRWVDVNEASDIVLDPADGRKPLVIERLTADTGFTARFSLSTGIADLIASLPQNQRKREYGS